MTLFHEESSEHLDSRFTIACRDELVEGAKKVLREVALVVMTRGSFRGISMSAPFYLYTAQSVNSRANTQGVGGAITHL